MPGGFSRFLMVSNASFFACLDISPKDSRISSCEVS